MRALTTPMLIALAKQITNPVYLFKIDLGSQYVYASSREEISYAGDTYFAMGAKLQRVDSKRLSFSLPNHDRSISALAFTGQIQGNECLVYLHYEGNVVGRFTGLLDSPECGGDYNFVTFRAVDAYSTVRKWPVVRMREPTFNHLPAPGTTLDLGATTLHLERDRTR